MWVLCAGVIVADYRSDTLIRNVKVRQKAEYTFGENYFGVVFWEDRIDL